MFFLFGAPAHSNMGDQAQSYCIQKWISENYPEYGIFFFRLPETYDSLLKVLRKTIKYEDKIICHSGYHLTDLYKEQSVYCKIARIFLDKKIWIFPQTINYVDESCLIQTADIMNKHKNITLMVRDEVSFVVAQKYFRGCRLFLYPDIVTSLIGTMHFNHCRDGILFCIRNDVEAYYKKEQIEKLKQCFVGFKVEETDTTIKMPYRSLIKDREKILLEILDYYSHFKLIITDRYHGTIFSLISGTPVIVLRTNDHKLSSGVKWFPDEYKEYVSYVDDISEVYGVAKEMMNRNLTNLLSPYFKEKYYDVLKNKLENDCD